MERDILLCDRLRQSCNTGLRKRVVDLSRVSMHTRGTRDVDDIPRLAVLDSEVRRSCPDNLERRSSVYVDDCVPLLVRHLVDDAVPCVPGIVNDDVDLAAAELCGFLDEIRNVCIVEDIAGDRDSSAAALVDLICYRLCFLYYLSAGSTIKPARNVLASTSATTTLAPSLANNLAASAPIPCPEPVMIAV